MFSQKTLIGFIVLFGAFIFAATRHNLLPVITEFRQYAVEENVLPLSNYSRYVNTTRHAITSHVNALMEAMGNVSLRARAEENTSMAETNLPILNGTIVVCLHGEFGNHLSVLGQALVVQRLALKNYGIRAKLILRHNEGQFAYKWMSSRDNIQKCFPRFRSFDFTEANTEEFDRLDEEQTQQLKVHNMSKIADDKEEPLSESLSLWRRLLETPKLNLTQPPFFKVTLHGWGIFDSCLDDIRRFMKFDKQACCRVVPDADESVFHFRNFMAEMKRRPDRAKKLGFWELSANKTAYELYVHLKPGDKVAITTRFGGEYVEPYVTALEERGLKVRVITNQSAVEDFCFLLSAKKELTGNFKSTFVRWAALLGDMDRVELYYLNYPERERDESWSSTNMSDPRFKRIQVKQYNSEGQEQLDRNNIALE